MKILLSILFTIFISLYSIVVTLALIILNPLSNNSTLANHLTRYWSRLILFFLKNVNGVNHEILGIEKVPDEPCIIACKHQSMWDTVIFHIIFNAPSYIYKQELHKIPVYGWYIKKMGNVPVDRDGSAMALKNMIKQAKEVVLKQNRKLIIFPQGTRTPLNSNTKEYPYQIGIAALYKSLNVKVIPVALNSGKFWGKKNIIKNKGKITLKFLDPIEAGLNKDEFMKILEEKIESESKKLG